MTPEIPQDWPNRDLSRQVNGPHHIWHVQVAGDGPVVLLLHGAGGSVHSFRGMIPLLAGTYRIVAPDLPGHGFTKLGARNRSGLVPMAQDIAALCDAQGWSPDAIVGHSAGAAIALEIARHRRLKRLVGINPALDHFEGLAGLLFPAMAKALSVLPFAARLFSGASATPARVRALIDGTGSQLDSEGIELYRRLIAREAHVSGALMMMAQWSLTDLLDALPGIPTETLFITGARDRTVPASVARKAAARMPNAQVDEMPGLGHLIHEEAPELVAARIRAFLGK